jgi:hypothetical protein
MRVWLHTAARHMMMSIHSSRLVLQNSVKQTSVVQIAMPHDMACWLWEGQHCGYTGLVVHGCLVSEIYTAAAAAAAAQLGGCLVVATSTSLSNKAVGHHQQVCGIGSLSLCFLCTLILGIIQGGGPQLTHQGTA